MKVHKNTFSEWVGTELTTTEMNTNTSTKYKYVSAVQMVSNAHALNVSQICISRTRLQYLP